MAKKLYFAETTVLAYFWAEEGEEIRGAHDALWNEANEGLSFVQPERIMPAEGTLIDTAWVDAYPWGEPPDDLGSATVSEILNRGKE